MFVLMESGQGCERTDGANCESHNFIANDKDPKTYTALLY